MLKQQIGEIKATKDIDAKNKKIEEIDVKMAGKNIKLKGMEHKNTNLMNCLFGFKSGVLHLYQKLENVQTDEKNIDKIEEKSIKQILKTVAYKMKQINEFVKKNKKFAEMLQK